MTIPAQSKAVVPTDISIAVPEGTYGRVAPRSGLAVKHFIDTGAGVIDYDYRGPVGVVLFNFGQKDFVIEEGDRIAQLVLEKVLLCDAVEVEVKMIIYLSFVAAQRPGTRLTLHATLFRLFLLGTRLNRAWSWWLWQHWRQDQQVDLSPFFLLSRIISFPFIATFAFSLRTLHFSIQL